MIEDTCLCQIKNKRCGHLDILYSKLFERDLVTAELNVYSA